MHTLEKQDYQHGTAKVSKTKELAMAIPYPLMSILYHRRVKHRISIMRRTKHS